MLNCCFPLQFEESSENIEKKNRLIAPRRKGGLFFMRAHVEVAFKICEEGRGTRK